MRILVVEDEEDLNRVICKKLAAEGYGVDGCLNGQQALDYLASAEYDGVIMDVMMPVMDGLTALRRLRTEHNNPVPVLLLTARDAIENRVQGLDGGANDYLIKPFSFDELTARIRAMTRPAATAASSLFQVANLAVDTAAHTVLRCGQPVVLSAREFAVLEYLIRNQGVVLSREKIEEHVWNFDYEGGTNIVDVYIRYLRKKIDDGYQPKLIHTVRGSGYVLREEP